MVDELSGMSKGKITTTKELATDQQGHTLAIKVKKLTGVLGALSKA